MRNLELRITHNNIIISSSITITIKTKLKLSQVLIIHRTLSQRRILQLHNHPRGMARELHLMYGTLKISTICMFGTLGTSLRISQCTSIIYYKTRMAAQILRTHHNLKYTIITHSKQRILPEVIPSHQMTVVTQSSLNNSNFSIYNRRKTRPKMSTRYTTILAHRSINVKRAVRPHARTSGEIRTHPRSMLISE